MADSIGVAPVGATVGTGTGDVFVEVGGVRAVGDGDAVPIRGVIGVSVGWLVGAEEHAETPPVSSTAAVISTAVRMPPR